MSVPPSQRAMSAAFSGAVDLGAVAAQKAQAAAMQAHGIESMTEANANDLVQDSTRRPVFILLVSASAPQCAELTARVAAALRSYGSGVRLATLDVDVEQGLAQVFQVQAVPAMMALLQGRPIPLFQGSPDDAQLQQVFDQVLQVAAQAGMEVATAESGSGDAGDAPMSPVQREAYDAIQRDDLDAAIAIYDKALRENPKDADAKAGRAQVSLFVRTRSADPATVRAQAAAAPQSDPIHLVAADLDILAGAVEDAFSRVLDTVAASSGPDKEAARVRLLELFEVVGLADPRVTAARKVLASLLN